MGLDWYDLVTRIESRFGLRIEGQDILEAFEKNGVRDLTVGDVFAVVRSKLKTASGMIDHELDAESLWTIYEQLVCEAFVVKNDEFDKGTWFIRELKA